MKYISVSICLLLTIPISFLMLGAEFPPKEPVLMYVSSIHYKGKSGFWEQREILRGYGVLASEAQGQPLHESRRIFDYDLRAGESEGTALRIAYAIKYPDGTVQRLLPAPYNPENLKVVAVPLKPTDYLECESIKTGKRYKVVLVSTSK